MTKHYSEINSSPNFPNIEKAIISYWQENKIFDISVKGDEEFVFYDGPPFANGLPHYGHLLTGFIKDLFARYQTMNGKKVERRFGWDCHGLPAEMGAEKELGISGKKQIEEFGIDQFNAHCRTSVLKYVNEWQDYVHRQARWVDFIGGYKTMDISYMESVLWAFKTIYDKGLIYQSMRVMPYSWACETPVSDFETRMDNSYREKQSKSIIVSFLLKDKPEILLSKDKQNENKYVETQKGRLVDLQPCYAIAWTTTPWTLPSNLALAVGLEIEYVVVRCGNRDYIIAKNLLNKYENEIGNNIIGECLGRDLIGLSYQPLFSYFEFNPNSFVILAGEFVTTEDGTGIVHIAPGFGEDDQKLCAQHNISLVCPVDNGGKFTNQVSDFSGRNVFEATDDIIIFLKKQSSWLKTEQYLHNYPHCWRTDTPLIYKAVPSWYLKVTEIKEKMIANNQKINWIPFHIRDGLFGKWLENARDWSISRNRYWGCPIPIWQSDDPLYPHIEVYGSIEELEKAFNVKVLDLHRPFIDSLVKPNPSDPTGKSMLRRVPEILDCWFESGSMPYAQVHYPFENKNWFEQNFPADFIVEYVAQTRGWFYTMMVLSTALFDQPPFLNCICHGVILGNGGEKLSKRLKNYADPQEVFDKIGSDAMRWFMISSQVMRGQEIIIDNEASGIRDALRNVIKPLWNAYNFFVLYANIDEIEAQFYSIEEINDVKDSNEFKTFAKFDGHNSNILDRYIISKCLQVCAIVENKLNEYETVTATRAIDELIEVLNNWYIRRSRERFWRSEKNTDKIQAYNTLFTVLSLICRISAPFLPMISEQIYRGLTKEKSVHLRQFPKIRNEFIDLALIHNMERVRAACTAALHIRNEIGIRVRQPLQKVTFIGVSDDSSNLSFEMQQLVLDEINVKEWVNLNIADIEKFAERILQINLPKLGKRIPHKIKDIIVASKQGKWKVVENNQIMICQELLTNEEFEFKLKPKDFIIQNSYALHDSLVILDTTITEDLKNEGIARDLVRFIQQERKNMGLDITNRIAIDIYGNEKSQEIIKSVLNNWSIYIKEQTLANNIDYKVFSENKNNIEKNEKLEGEKKLIEKLEIEKDTYIYPSVTKA